jgi:hypothetical protein
LNQLDPPNKASKFAAICQSLFRPTNPHLSNIPADFGPSIKLLRLIRNTVHSAWAHFPDNRKDETVVFKGATFHFVTGQPLNFISWDLMGEISESALQIVIAVVRDAHVVRLPPIEDFGLEKVLAVAQGKSQRPAVC